jgi:hypothetical protein
MDLIKKFQVQGEGLNIGAGALRDLQRCSRYVTPDRKIYCETIKMCRLAEEIDFFAPNSCSLPWLGKWRNTVVHLLKRV